MHKVKKLNESQVKDFDVEYMTSEARRVFKRKIDALFSDTSFTLLDIGGGNGVFVDQILELYPNSEAVLVDNSEYLLSRNRAHERKNLVCCSADEIFEKLENQKFDLICLNWVLHHLVFRTYAETTNALQSFLNGLNTMLSNRGRISIFENMYNGAIVDNLPSILVYHLTSSKLLAKVTKRMGANTAGVGVCFRSKQNWIEQIIKSNLQMESYWEESWQYEFDFLKKFVFHLGKVRVGHFLVKSSY